MSASDLFQRAPDEAKHVQGGAARMPCTGAPFSSKRTSLAFQIAVFFEAVSLFVGFSHYPDLQGFIKTIQCVPAFLPLVLPNNG